MSAPKLHVGLLYGGRSGEHEVSLRSARAVLDALDPSKYAVTPIGLTREGVWTLQRIATCRPDEPGAPLMIAEDAPAVFPVPGTPVRLIGLGAATPASAAGPATAAAAPPIDLFLPVLHGPHGEDGTLQGLLELLCVPYVGSGVLGSAVAMDKDVAKRLLTAAGVPVVDGLVLRDDGSLEPRAALGEVQAACGLPCFIKPANLGSSVGVHKVTEAEDFEPALRDALRYDTKVLVERAIDAREVEVAVLGNDRPRASIVGEIVPHHDFYSYEAKYLDDDGAALLVPAPLDETTSSHLRELAVRAFRVLELRGLARVDFFIDRKDGTLYVNEVNTLPGFTSVSMYPLLWQATGLAPRELLDTLIGLALEHHARRARLSTRRDAG